MTGINGAAIRQTNAWPTAGSTSVGTRLVGLTLTGGAAVLQGGGVYCVGGAVALDRCVLHGNEGGSYGGGIAANGSSLIVRDCVIRENSAFRGAGIRAYGSLEVERSRIVSNRDSNNYDEGALGGGVVLGGPASFVDCVVDSNWASGGGGLYVFGSPALSLVRTSVSYNRAVGFHNEESRGGGMVLEGAQARLIDCELRGNGVFGKAFPSVGAVLIERGALMMQGCVVADNLGGDAVGGIYAVRSQVSVERTLFLRNEGDRCGALLMGSLVTVDIAACTFLGNRVYQAGGASAMAVGGTASIRNCILATNLGGVPVTGPSVEATCTNAFGNTGGDWVGALAGQDSVPGNISLDPLFCQPSIDDYHLQWGSPCLPASSGACGLIGAFGFGGCASVAIRPETWARVKATFRD